MANISISEMRGGSKVIIDGNPCSIMENEHVKPGKGQAFNRIKLRNLKTGRIWERTFKSGDIFLLIFIELYLLLPTYENDELDYPSLGKNYLHHMLENFSLFAFFE